MKLSLLKKEINPHDIFYAEHFNFYGKKNKHYFYCIYSEKKDINNKSNKFIIGLLITTKKQNNYIEDYSQTITLNNKKAFVRCNEEFKFKNDSIEITKKHFTITPKDTQNIIRCYERFIKEKKEQMKRRIKNDKHYQRKQKNKRN